MRKASLVTAHTLDPSAGVERFGYRQELQRSLSFRDLVTYGLIFMVPIAPFGIFGSVFQASNGMVALAYVLGMVAMMVTASSYGVNARAYPVAGSVYSYAGRAIAPWVGFLAGWTILLDYILVPGLLSLVAAVSMTAVLPSVPVWVWIVAFVVVNAVINLAGIKTTRRVNTVALVGALGVLATFVVAAILALASGAGRGFSWEPVFSSTQFQIGTLLTAMSVCMLSFLGFDAMSTLAEDVKGGPRQVSRGMIAALAIIGVLFVVQSYLAALLVESPATLIADGDPTGTAFYDAARVAAGPWLATVTALATALAWGLANNMVAQVATSRLLYAMARDRQLPAFLAKVSVSRSVPVNGILLTAAISLGLHETAHAVNPLAKVIYVDKSPMVLAHARALLTAQLGAAAPAYIDADLREPDTILGDPALRETLDLTRPVGLLLIAVMHFITDDDSAYDVVRQLLGALPAGSHLVMTHLTGDLLAEDVRADFDSINQKAGIPVRCRSRKQFDQFFTGLVLAEPGIVPINRWRAEAETGPRPSDTDTAVYGALAIKT